MLKAHLDAVENQLLATSRIPANAGHMLHRGTPREAFIREFLQGHISTRVSIGTGEIIDATSEARQSRNQFDIVIYRNDYPKIDLGGGISAFLVESVIATIEVKSLLTEAELDVAIRNAGRAKRLQRNVIRGFSTGYIPPGILSFVVAYDGAANISTVYGWLHRSEVSQGLNRNPLPPTGDQRLGVLSESLEGVFCLGVGSLVFDNSPIGLIRDDIRAAHPDVKYTEFSQPVGNLLWLFLMITQAVSGVSAEWANLVPYLSRVQTTGTFRP